MMILRDCGAKFNIEIGECMESYQMSQRIVWRMQALVQVNQTRLLEAWYEWKDKE